MIIQDLTEKEIERLEKVADAASVEFVEKQCAYMAIRATLKTFALFLGTDLVEQIMKGVPGKMYYSFQYINHRGETALRNVRFLGLRFGTSEYYAVPQWLMRAYDFEKKAEREFAMNGISELKLVQDR